MGDSTVKMCNQCKKTKIIPDDWVQATIDGSKDALKRIVEHCRLDCIVLEEVHQKLTPYIRSISCA